MADQTAISINEHLAINVLEWTPGETRFQWNDKDGNRVLDGILFEPQENIEQAFRCFKKLGKNVSLNIREEKTGFHSLLVFHDENRPPVSLLYNESYEQAISLVVAKATGWEGEL